MSDFDPTVYDDLPDGVVVCDGSGTVRVVNRAAERILRTTSDGSVGLLLREVLPLVDEQGRDWWDCADPFRGLSTRSRQPERRLLLPDGRALLVTSSSVRDAERTLQRLVVAIRDDRARERTDRSRADLVSTVAHELRSPLTSVKGFTATLLAKWDRFNDEQKQVMLQTVNADADRVTRLLTELLDVSRIDAGRIEVRRQVVDLGAVARKAVAGRIAGGEPEDRFVVTELPGIGEVWADPDKLDQVVGNLVENALRHGAGTVSIDISPWQHGVEVVVSDEGDGISEDTAARVFTRFWRGGDRRGGTGLGLYIVKGMVEAHGGSVEVRRAPSGGAAFRFVLPAGTPSFL
jgi:signal transduction histidine kinase